LVQLHLAGVIFIGDHAVFHLDEMLPLHLHELQPGSLGLFAGIEDQRD
jgi:hypothetical protein